MPGAFLRDDLSGIFRTEEFGSVVRILSGSRAGEEVVCILDEPASDVFGVATSTPTMHAPDAIVLERGVVVEIEGREYKLQEPEPDRTGVIRYPLNEV